MVLEEYNKWWKLELFNWIEKKMAPVWSIDVFNQANVWERLYKF